MSCISGKITLSICHLFSTFIVDLRAFPQYSAGFEQFLRSGRRPLFAYIVNLDLQDLVCLYLNEPAYLKSHEIVGLSLPTF